MRIKNNDITLTRGETTALDYVGVRRDGKPYVLAPAANILAALQDRYDYAVAAFTVKTGVYGDIVLAKYLDLEAPPMYDGTTDNAPGGFHKFSTQDITVVSALSDMTDTTKVYQYTQNGVTGYYTRLHDGSIKQYRFSFIIPIYWNDLESLEAKEYTYDLTLYYGQLTAQEIAEKSDVLHKTVDAFPLYEDVNLVKVPLITPHKFILEDSNNV